MHDGYRQPFTTVTIYITENIFFTQYSSRSVDFYHFMPFSVAFTFDESHNVSRKQNLFESFSRPADKHDDDMALNQLSLNAQVSLLMKKFV